MRNHRFAEDLLALFTSRDVSASIVGDLIEQANSRGRGWFTCEVARLALALCFRSVVSAPARALRLLALGFVVYAGTYVAVFIATGLPWYPWHRVHEFGFFVRLGLVVLIANLLTGVVLARLPASGSMSAIAPLTALWLAAWLIGPLFKPLQYLGPLWGGWRGVALAALAFPVLYLLPLLLGAIAARRRIAGPTT